MKGAGGSSLPLSLSTEGSSAVLPCLKRSSDVPPDQQALYEACHSERLIQLSGGLPGLGIQVGPLGVLVISNVSDQMGGFYLCQQGSPSQQAWQPGWTVSVNGSGEVPGGAGRAG